MRTLKVLGLIVFVMIAVPVGLLFSRAGRDLSLVGSAILDFVNKIIDNLSDENLGG